jgi:hypothetical protein
VHRGTGGGHLNPSERKQTYKSPGRSSTGGFVCAARESNPQPAGWESLDQPSAAVRFGAGQRRVSGFVIMVRDRSRCVGLQYKRRPKRQIDHAARGKAIASHRRCRGAGPAVGRGGGRPAWLALGGATLGGVRPRPILHVARPVPLRPSAARRRIGRSCEAQAVQRLADRAWFPITRDRPPMAAHLSAMRTTGSCRRGSGGC